MSIILASTSPRRSELLALLGIAFEIVPPTAEEVRSPNLSPRDQAKQFASRQGTLHCTPASG